MKHFGIVIKKEKRLVFIYLVLGIALAFAETASVGYYQTLIDRFSGGNLTLGNIVIYGGLLLFLCVGNYIDEFPSSKLENEFYLQFKLNALEKISRIDYQAYLGFGTGKLVQKIENGAQAGKNILFQFWLNLFKNLIPSVLFSLYFIYCMDTKVAAVILLGYLIVFIITRLLLKSLYRIKEKILINEEMFSGYLVRGFMEMVVFRINRRFRAEIEKAKRAKSEVVENKVHMRMIHEAFFSIFYFLVILMKLGILLYGWRSKELTVGTVISLLALIDNAYTPIAIFNVEYVQYKLDLASFERFKRFLEAPEDEQLIKGKEIDGIDGSIAFCNVSFHYNESSLIEDLNLLIPEGQKLALAGESGSGKSTLIKLATGLLKPDAGEIEIAPYALKEVSLHSFYKQVHYISQESPVFDGTLRENLVFDRNIPDEQLIKALDKVSLTEFYQKLKLGLDTPLGERGVTMSGGERQRLVLARLWFSDAKIIIMDEASSAMDNITEEKVLHQVMELLKEKTVIVIAHRLRSIRDFQRILVFRDGKIAGDGSFRTLLDENAYFSGLYHGSLEQI